MAELTDEQREANARRQAEYRQRRRIKGDRERVTAYIDTVAADRLRTMCREMGTTQAALLEQLINEARSRQLDLLTDEELSAHSKQPIKTRTRKRA